MGGAPGLLIFALPGPEALPPPPPWAVLETTLYSCRFEVGRVPPHESPPP